MKFSVSSVELQKSLNLIGGVIPSKSTLPILENFLFELTNSTLKVTATDLDIFMTIVLTVQGSKDGRVAVPAKRLLETVRALPTTDVEFVVESNTQKIVMKTINGEYKLSGEASDAYPSVPSFKGTEEITLTADLARSVVAKTSFAVSIDELRPAMMGVLYQLKKNEFRSVATDGHRLVKYVKSISTGVKGDRDVIIPAKALNIVAKSVTGSECKMAFSDTHILFAASGATLISRLIEERYPNYESVIPLDNEKQLTVNASALIQSVRRTALYASSTTHQVRLSLRKNSLTVSAEDIDFGSEAKETVPCEYTAEALEIGFNATYIVDILSHINTTDVVMMLSSPTRACIVKPVTQEEGEDLLMLVMPVRLNT